MIFIVFSILAMYYTAKLDAEHYLMGHYFSDHTTRFLQRSGIALLIMYFSFWKAVVFSLLFWALFDGIRNYLVGKDIFYIGNQAETDKFFTGKFNLYIGSKIIALIIALII